MTGIENQIAETWRIHNRISLFVIKNLSDDETERHQDSR